MCYSNRSRLCFVLDGSWICFVLTPLSAKPTKWSNTQTIHWQQPTNCLYVFDHFVGLALKELIKTVFFFIELVIYKCISNAVISECLSNDKKWDNNNNLLSWSYTMILWKTMVKKNWILISFAFYQICLSIQSSRTLLNTTDNSPKKA